MYFPLFSSSEESGPLNPKEPGENATGLYRKHFTLPLNWNTKNKNTGKNNSNEENDGGNNNENDRIFIIFEGVDSCANFWLNGIYLGFSKDSCLPCEFDITDIVKGSGKDKEHLLAVQVG